MSGPADELHELADTVDGMLDRLADAFQTQRRFVANASHELRTPLTVIRAEVEVTLADPDATEADLRHMGEAVLEAADRTQALLDSLMVLARSQQALPRREPVDLALAARTAADASRHRGVRPRRHRPPRPRAVAADRRPAAGRAPRRQPRRERRAPQRDGRPRRRHRPARASCTSRTPGRRSARRTCAASPSRSSACTATARGPAPGSACRSCARSPTPTAPGWTFSRARAAGWSPRSRSQLSVRHLAGLQTARPALA